MYENGDKKQEATKRKTIQLIGKLKHMSEHSTDTFCYTAADNYKDDTEQRKKIKIYTRNQSVVTCASVCEVKKDKRRTK